MAKRSKSHAITLVELLVILAVLWFSFVILFSMQRTHQPTLAYRLSCGTNLAGIGKAMLLYSNDYQDQLPRAGGASTKWAGRVADWRAKDRKAAFGLDANDAGGQASISASLYLLVRYTEVTPKSFVCREEQKTKAFKLEDYGLGDGKASLFDLWDFGPDPSKHCSYAYQMLYGMPPLTMYGEPNFAVAADRNPWMEQSGAKGFARFRPDIAPFTGTPKQARLGNAVAHDGEGQNVLFLDTHVEFKKLPYCSLAQDNIYTSWDGRDRIRGKQPMLGSQPADARDSLLVNDPPAVRR